jgi:hypothetical protein
MMKRSNIESLKSCAIVSTEFGCIPAGSKIEIDRHTGTLRTVFIFA